MHLCKSEQLLIDLYSVNYKPFLGMSSLQSAPRFKGRGGQRSGLLTLLLVGHFIIKRALFL